jgi:hypothetical protein
MLLSIVNTHLCCAAVSPVFSPIIYVIIYSDGLCHPTSSEKGSKFGSLIKCFGSVGTAEKVTKGIIALVPPDLYNRIHHHQVDPWLALSLKEGNPRPEFR